MVEIAKIEEEIFISSELLDEFQWNFEENIICDNIKCHKKSEFTLSLENTILEKPQAGGGQIDPPVFLGFKELMTMTQSVEPVNLTVLSK